MKSKWREYLKGKVEVKDKDKMNWEIRTRAKQMMKDLLLIAQKMPQQQRTRIFKDPKTRNELVVPLATELFNNASFGTGQKEYEDIMRIEAELTAMDKQHGWVKLIEDKNYRRNLEIWLINNSDTYVSNTK